MVTNIIPIAIAAIFIALISLLYRVIYKKLPSSITGLLLSNTIIWVFILIFPRYAGWLYVPLVNYAFTNIPELQFAAWDVAAALAVYLGMWLSYLLGFIAGCIATSKLVIRSRNNRASET
ncbi:MAG: hypothetical protein U5M23_00100 [Marinagarivorans sp.]|nr:hypothetical protein [Marinagarivorans sp.]